MDYCSSCRRHLNGALVCPGCGAYAPDIAPVPTHGHAVRAGTAGTTSPYAATAHFTPAPYGPASSTPAPVTAAPLAGPLPERVPARVPDRALDVALGLDADAYPDVDLTSETASSAVAAVSAAPQGRAARRRQLARWKKNQRRAVVVTAVTLVSGLAVAALERQNGDRTQAASAPETPTAAGGEEPTLEHTVPTVSRSDGHRNAPSATSPRQSPATGHARKQDTPADSRPDSAAAPAGTTALSTPETSGQQRGHGSSAYSSTVGALTGTAGQQSSDSATTGGSGSSTSGSGSGSASDAGTASGTGSNSSSSSASSGSSSSSSGTGSGTAATSPSDVCLLGLICLG
ncbi:hypothetical protein QFZ66_004513 [Streptomyces sp. B4I13]|uniref:SCO2400 family protein n=1 Tax=Streptomyces sp. B4I13 TaxID=3042271 RepID=UPI00277E7D96|nr:hypothetical protein [Streptomyces sp. B4I13]MDQ0960635.1 hypothetical protein [Streptomyces sp. B4I13]